MHVAKRKPSHQACAIRGAQTNDILITTAYIELRQFHIINYGSFAIFYYFSLIFINFLLSFLIASRQSSTKILHIFD